MLNFAERHSEAAFAELVRRHIDFVHSAALRMVNDSHLAKDVSQGVFIALAKNAEKLTVHPVLSGWLHRTTRNIATQLVRTDVRRRNREHEAATMSSVPESNAEWKEMAPHLDAALADLSEPDRDAVLLRYFENKPAQEMAAILGISSEAAQKRVSRAVDRLREAFAKRGIAAGSAGLSGIISANAVQAAPIGLATTLSIVAISGTTVGASAVVTATQVIAMTTLQKSLIAATLTLFAGFGIYQSRQAEQLRKKVQALEQVGKRSTAPMPQQQATGDQNTLGLARNGERLLRNNSELEQRNAELKEDLIQLQQEKAIAQEQSSFLENITMKLASDEELQVPQTIPELAVLYGQVQLRSRNFYEKWNGRIPADGTPDAIIYKEELDASFADDATLMKGMRLLKDHDIMKDASSMAQFQSTQLYGALGLDESQWSQLNGALNLFYEGVHRRKLNGASRPATGLGAWEEQRMKMGQKAFTEIQSYLTPQQRSELTRLYTANFFFGLALDRPKPKK